MLVRDALARRGRPRGPPAPGRRSSPAYPRADGSLAGSRQRACENVEERAVAWKQDSHSQGAYLSDVVPYFENIVVAMEREEAFERGRRLGLEPFMPFWDPEVVDFSVRTPPRLLHSGHRAKGILRGTLAKRFPSRRLRGSEENPDHRLLDRDAHRADPTGLGGVPGGTNTFGEWNRRRNRTTISLPYFTYEVARKRER